MSCPFAGEDDGNKHPLCSFTGCLKPEVCPVAADKWKNCEKVKLSRGDRD